MTERTIKYKSYNRLSCSGCTPADIIICVTPAKVLAQDCAACTEAGVSPIEKSYITGQLQQSCRLQDTCGTYFYQYIISYNDDQLVNNELLAVSDIQGVFCKGCMTDWVEDIVGSPSKVCADTESVGDYIFTNNQECEYNIVQTAITAVDTDSINLTVSGTKNHTIQADVVLDPTSNNALSVLDTGLFVASYLGETAGTAGAQTLTTSPVITLVQDQVYSIVAGVSCTGAVSLTINGVTANLLLRNGKALLTGQWIAGNRYLILKAPSNYVLLNPSSEWQTYSPTPTGFSAVPTDVSYRYKISPDGNSVTLCVQQNTVGTSNATSFTIPLPITAATVTNAVWKSFATGVDNTTPLTTPASVNISSGATAAVLYKDAASGAWTAGDTGKSASFTIEYEI